MTEQRVQQQEGKKKSIMKSHSFLGHLAASNNDPRCVRGYIMHAACGKRHGMGLRILSAAYFSEAQNANRLALQHATLRPEGCLHPSTTRVARRASPRPARWMTHTKAGRVAISIARPLGRGRGRWLLGGTGVSLPRGRGFGWWMNHTQLPAATRFAAWIAVRPSAGFDAIARAARCHSLPRPNALRSGPAT